MKWRKANNWLHRYLGFFFFGTTLVYGCSGIAMNHLDDWDPSYIVIQREVKIEYDGKMDALDESTIKILFDDYMGKYDYKSHYYPNSTTLKVFTREGSITIDTRTKKGMRERLVRKPLFYGINYLHYNPIKWWTYFSDLYAVALIILAITGLVVRKRDNGLSGIGGWLTLAGILIPFLFIVMMVDFSNF